MCFAPQRRALFRNSTSQAPKVVRTWCVLYIFTSKCASRHSGVHFFDIATSKSGPRMVCFVHFDLQMCFAPQRRALFRHRNVQKWSEPGVFCTFSLGNVLRATTACTFSTSQLPKVVRPCGVLYIFTWKCASRHNGVHFFISHLASCLRTRRFSEPTFRPSGATNHWKNTVNRDFPTFSRICIFFLLIFSLLTLLTSAFQLSILSEVSLLNFLRLFHIFPYVPMNLSFFFQPCNILDILAEGEPGNPCFVLVKSRVNPHFCCATSLRFRVGPSALGHPGPTLGVYGPRCSWWPTSAVDPRGWSSIVFFWCQLSH